MQPKVKRHGSTTRRSLSMRLVLPLALALGCGSDSSSGDSDNNDKGPEDKPNDAVKVEHPEPLVITADWIAGTLSFASFDALADKDATKADAVTSTLDLSKYKPGPLSLELSPDGKKLLVAVSTGFFAIPLAGQLLLDDPNIPAGDAGSLLIIDVDTQKVEAELKTGNSPIGIAITPDSKRALVSHFGTGDMSIIDLVENKIESTFEVGLFAEEIAFDDTGTVGIIGLSEAGDVRTFAVADPEGTMSEPVKIVDDSAGVAFFPGTKKALAVQAPSPLTALTQGFSAGYALIDVSDPAAPRVLEDVRWPKLVGVYPAMPAPNRKTVIVPTAEDDIFTVREYELDGDKVKLKQSIEVGEAKWIGALGLAYDGKDTVVMASPGKRALIVTNLETGDTHTVDWDQKRAGPSDVVYR